MPSLFEDSESNTEQSSPMLAAPRLLVELEVPGKTGPVPSGEWGINIAAARENFSARGAAGLRSSLAADGARR